MISAMGIAGSIITTIFALHIMRVDKFEQISSTLKYQLIISTIIITPLLYLSAYITLPEDFQLPQPEGKIRHRYHAMICSMVGLYAGLVIGKNNLKQNK